MAAPLISLEGIGIATNSGPLFEGLDLALGGADRLCLLGRNGAGKSTLLKLLAGLVAPDSGRRAASPAANIVYLAQEPDLSGHAALADYIAAGLPPGDADAGYRVEAALDEIDLAGDADPATLSGGEKRRAALARAFLGDPDLLLLDEPTNHLDLPAIAWLEDRLAAYRGGFLVISHDRAFLGRLARGVLWLDRGRLKRFDGPFGQVEDWMETEYAREAEAQAKLDKRIAEESRWAREGITARRKRNQGRLRRLDAMRAERRAQIPRQGTAALEAADAGQSGKKVIEAEHLAKSYGERVILKDFSIRIHRGDRIGIVGPNGAGKTTLVRLLLGEIAPDAGTVRLGTKLEPLVIEQDRSSLKEDATPWGILTGSEADQVMVRGQPKHVVAYLRDFLFTSQQAKAPVRSLSGGERNRLILARELAKPSNLMVLDEPTNDLDLETLDLLEDMLADYDGTLLLISHDRDFLDRLVTSTVFLDGRGGAREFAGGFSDAIRQMGGLPDWARPKQTAARKAKKPAAPPRRTKNQPSSARAEPASGPGRADFDRLKTLSAEIERLGREIALLEKALADPEAYNRAPEKYTMASKRLGENRKRLAEAEDEWLELEMKRGGGE